MQVFYDSLVLQAHELISPWYSMRNIRSLFGGRQRVLFEDEQDFGQIMVINGLRTVEARAFADEARRRDLRSSIERQKWLREAPISLDPLPD